MPAPSIMTGVAESRPPRDRSKVVHAPRSDEVAGLKLLPPPAPGASSGASASLGAPSSFGGVADCAGELARIANYAAHLAEGVAASPNDDLLLFDASGLPTGNLARALVNMAAVEIGPDRPRMALVAAAVSQLRRLLDDPARAAAATPPADEKAGPEKAARKEEDAHQPQ
jgi:hypothetical protein